MVDTNIIVILLIAAIILLAVLYIIRAKKRGQKCIGCPNSKQCGGKCNSNYSQK